MKSVNYKVVLVFLFIIAFSFYACNKTKQEPKETLNQEEITKMEQEFKNFAKPLEKEVAKAYTASALAYWTASNTGKSEDFDKSSEMEIQLDHIFANKDTFAKIKKFKESGLIQDEVLSRDLELMYLAFLGKQIDTAKLAQMTKMQSDISKKFQNYRAMVDGKKLSDNDVEHLLKTSKDSKILEKTWKAHKSIGPLVAQDIIKLVKLRNAAAKELGFNNFHEMSLKLNEQDPEEISKIFDELDNLTRKDFEQLKEEIDDSIAIQCKIKPKELMPWHYQNRYFQEAPKIYSFDIDKYYHGKDLVKLVKKYYTSLDMPIDSMVAKSDLFGRKGKNQHAYCIDIDRDTKDIRVLANVVDNYDWMNTLLHEFGHAVYFKYQGEDLPWFVKTPAQIFTTEAVAMHFGRFATNAQWMQDMLGLSNKEKENIEDFTSKKLRLEQLVFSRWAQVMYRFEKSLYENPDQDLNKLWWDLKEKYQLLKKPAERNEPDWATKIHIVDSPCYYHNYLLGELLASQLYHYAKTHVLNLPDSKLCSFYNQLEIGKFFIDKVFKPGALYKWNDMIERATGEKLTPKYYALQFVKNNNGKNYGLETAGAKTLQQTMTNTP